MGVKSFIAQCARTLKLAVKPGREELWLSIKISVLGIGAIGIIGFAIKLIGSFLGSFVTLTTVNAVGLIGSAAEYVSFVLGGV